VAWDKRSILLLRRKKQTASSFNASGAKIARAHHAHPHRLRPARPAQRAEITRIQPDHTKD
jgi:hypothetical protein